ncbi:thioether cross-link-forming SCIFF peptide maturase [Christensenellaceae bacterium OttesenSCG-928-K19]|nr:thioether cross-link-forming SCIFF peptide maturase [Christensenellaceae bacterium OttesenSCG-928-K19]
MVHLIEFCGKYAALDVESGSVHAIDREAMRVLTFKNAGKTNKQIRNDLGEGVEEVLQEIEELEQQGLLYSDPAENLSELKFNTPVIKALCLLVAQDCNLRCSYCFAETGEYHKNRALMSFDIAKKSLDFLVKHSGNRKNLEVDFFGGEPLINFDVVKKTVEYGRELEKKHDKIFRFTLTTNAYQVTDEMAEFLNREMKNVVISIDGRKEVHDKMRRDAGNHDTYDRVVKNAHKIVDGRGDKEYYIRGTFTHENLDFGGDVVAIADEGFDQISLEPVVTAKEYAIREEDLPQLKHEYEMLARHYVKRRKDGKGYNFFHFMIDLNSGPCLNKRLRGCGAGSEYLAVAADGSLYPCHQFAGIDKFYMGSVEEGTVDAGIKQAFCDTHIFTKKGCEECWAKYYCSGGCAANAWFDSGDLKTPYRIGCEMEKKRLEAAIAIKTFSDELV